MQPKQVCLHCKMSFFQRLFSVSYLNTVLGITYCVCIYITHFHSIISIRYLLDRVLRLHQLRTIDVDDLLFSSPWLTDQLYAAIYTQSQINQHQRLQTHRQYTSQSLFKQIQCRACRNMSECYKTMTWVVTLASVDILFRGYFPGSWRYCWLTAPLRRMCYGEKGCISIIITREKTKLSQGAPSPDCEARPSVCPSCTDGWVGEKCFPYCQNKALDCGMAAVTENVTLPSL